jgi:hypothetical protein
MGHRSYRYPLEGEYKSRITIKLSSLFLLPTSIQTLNYMNFGYSVSEQYGYETIFVAINLNMDGGGGIFGPTNRIFCSSVKLL